MNVILDTNIFVAAGFNPGSHSAELIDRIRSGELALLWDESTFAEIRTILEKIPPLNWDDFEPLFRPEYEVPRAETPPDLGSIEDPEDRKFAALAKRTGATLISNDDHLLDARGTLDLTILTPGEYLQNDRS